MFDYISKNLCDKLIDNGFHLLPTGQPGQETEELLLINPLSPVLYLVSLTADHDNLSGFSSHEKKLKDYAEFYEKNLDKFYCNHIIILTIFIGRNSGCVSDFAKDRSIIATDRTHFAYWAFDMDTGDILTTENQPSNILNIKDIGKSIFHTSDNKQKRLAIKSKKVYLPYFFIIFNALVFCVLYAAYYDNPDILFMNNGFLVFKMHEYYRVFTYMFLHADIPHLTYNSLSLFIFGSKVEKYYGRINFVLIYLLSGIGAGLLSACFTQGYSLGASGAVMGLMGACLSLSMIQRKPVENLSYYTILVFIIINIGAGFIYPDIDNAGHIGGLVCGFFISLLINHFSDN